MLTIEQIMKLGFTYNQALASIKYLERDLLERKRKKELTELASKHTEQRVIG